MKLKGLHSHPSLRKQKVVRRTERPLVVEPVLDKVVETIPDQVVKPVPNRVVKPVINPVGLVTCIIVNFKTAKLTKTALTTFTLQYPFVPVLLVDNGSADRSTKYVQAVGKSLDMVTAILHDKNIGHGPAMHKAILQADTRYVFTLDSDCEVLESGFLERMIKDFQSDDSLYATGWLRKVEPKIGVPVPNRKTNYLEYIHPSAALYDREKYMQLAPFRHTGAPCTDNMRDAKRKGFKVQSFPISQYVRHLEAGTRRMYKGKWNPRQNEEAEKWEREKSYPI